MIWKIVIVIALLLIVIPALSLWWIRLHSAGQEYKPNDQKLGDSILELQNQVNELLKIQLNDEKTMSNYLETQRNQLKTEKQIIERLENLERSQFRKQKEKRSSFDEQRGP